MSALMFLLVIGGLMALTIVGAVVVPLVTSSNSKELREARKERDDAERRASIAVKGLRAIANGAGNPILEASDALDRIESTYPKELN